MAHPDSWPTETIAVAARLWSDLALSPAIIAKIMRCTVPDLIAWTTQHPDRFPARPEISEQEAEQLILRERLSAIAGISVSDFDDVVTRLRARESVSSIIRSMYISQAAVTIIRKALQRDRPPRVRHQKRIPITHDQRAIILAAYDDGKTLKQIVALSGITLPRVRRIAAKAGRPARQAR